jgi:hypothetical protein
MVANGQTVDVRGEVNQFFYGRWKEGVFQSSIVIFPLSSATIRAYVDAQDGDEVLYGYNPHSTPRKMVTS